MIKLTQAPNIALATLWADHLRGAGLAASVQRYYLGAAAGELPPDQCLPEIWLDDPMQKTRALDLLKDLTEPPQRRWRCACGEQIEGGFEQCWQCGRWLPS